ncbi:uncharacterized protein [Venturia canescens]|uniref:uncharacterized protein n=1 Tax=Venturia canescens TaxID=32260 RepID=UPI001C9C7DAC|nr:uncharacterized protein LOC122415757 [Venturia canescens]
MISLRKSLLLLALFGLAVASDEVGINVKDDAPIIVQEMNLSSTFDNFLPKIRKFITMNGYDPMEIPDVEIPLSPLPGFLKTKMEMHHGYLQEVSTIYRTGDIIWQWTDVKGALYLNIGFETLDMSYEYALQYMLYRRKGDCYGRYHNVSASMLIDVDLVNHKGSLRFFKFTGFGDFKLRLEGHVADKLINVIIEAVTKIFRKEVLILVELKAQEEIEKMLKDINVSIPDAFQIKVKQVMKGHEFDEYMPHNIDYQNAIV